jgi:hypothetical protein
MIGGLIGSVIGVKVTPIVAAAILWGQPEDVLEGSVGGG